MNNLQKISIITIALLAIMSADNPGPLWTDQDVVIDSARAYQGVSVATRRSNGEIFVAVSGRFFEDTTRYGIRVYRSLDGINWSQYLWFSISQGHLQNPSMTIFTAQDSEFLYVAFDLWDVGANEYNTRAYRRNLALSSGLFRDISVIAGVPERDPSLCTSSPAHPNGPWLFCAFTSFDSIAFIRSSDYGMTWTDRQIIGYPSTNYGFLNPSCAYGWISTPPDSMSVGVAWQLLSNDETNGKIIFRKNTLNGMPGRWRPLIEFIPSVNCRDGFPHLQMTHGGFPSALITFVRIDTLEDNADLYYFFSTNGGDNWNYGIIYDSNSTANVAHCLVIDDSLGYYHVAYRGAEEEIFYQKVRYDSVSSPWSASINVKNGSSSCNPYYFPAVGQRNGEPYVCWVDYDPPVKLKFDAQWLQTGIKENQSARVPSPITITSNPVRDKFRVNYQVKNQGRVRIELYDVSGRLVAGLFESDMPAGQHGTKVETKALSAGVYFVVVDTPDGRFSERVVVVR
ncbi:MAG: T9SS type A sorting domain-containing protein [candidate division WOR-3 bacterium]